MPRLSTRRLLSLVFAAAFAAGLLAQVPRGLEVRSYDGAGNNLLAPELGAAGSWMLNRCRPGFADGLSAPAGADLPNPRQISNAVFDQAGDRFGDSRLSDLWWAFGQLLDHDLTLTHDSHDEFLGVPVPAGDRDFDPDSTGTVMLPLMRSQAASDERGLRRFANAISAYIDAGNVYGSDPERAAWLRSHVGGRLKTSAGELPPFNTLTGEYGSPVDTAAPGMDGMRRPDQRLFVCGDVRANENSLLASLHTLWLREHNRLADSLARRHPAAADEDLYQHARRLVAAQLQHITYAEWLPAIGIDLGPDPGYDPATDPGIANEFAAAAFRFGHSLVGSELWLVDAEGRPLPGGPLALRDVFFDPVAVVQRDGAGALLGGAARHRQQALDCKVVTDLRSFLFGRPGEGGLDLVALNIQRGRDRGLASFNDVRRDLGLPAYPSLGDLTDDGALVRNLERAYASIEDVDAWVGLLAERGEGGQMGPTLTAILSEQFGRIRAGDRLYYTRDPGLTGAERDWVAAQSLAAVIARNSSATTGPEAFRVPDDATGVADARRRSGEVGLLVAGQTARVSGLRPDEEATLVASDLVGRELWRRRLRADGAGDGRVAMGGEWVGAVALRVERSGERSIPAVIALLR